MTLAATRKLENNKTTDEMAVLDFANAFENLFGGSEHKSAHETDVEEILSKFYIIYQGFPLKVSQSSLLIDLLEKHGWSVEPLRDNK